MIPPYTHTHTHTALVCHTKALPFTPHPQELQEFQYHNRVTEKNNNQRHRDQHMPSSGALPACVYVCAHVSVCMRGSESIVLPD